MKEILMAAFAMITGFAGGVMYAREVYRPIVRWWKERRDMECGN